MQDEEMLDFVETGVQKKTMNTELHLYYSVKNRKSVCLLKPYATEEKLPI